VSGPEEAVLGLVMLAGLLGVVLPVLPGLLLVWGAGLAWVLLDGGGPLRWTVLAVMTALAAAGAAAPYLLPGRSARGAGAPWSTLAWGGVGMVVGFFAVPLIGLVLGGAAGVYLAELARLRDRRAAGRSTVTVVKAIGVGILLELAAGLLMVATWLAGVVLT
jgi:uncharacterized protein